MDVYCKTYKTLKKLYRCKILHKNLKFLIPILQSSYFKFSQAKNVKLNIIIVNAAETYVFAAFFCLDSHLILYEYSRNL